MHSTHIPFRIVRTIHPQPFLALRRPAVRQSPPLGIKLKPYADCVYDKKFDSFSFRRPRMVVHRFRHMLPDKYSSGIRKIGKNKKEFYANNKEKRKTISPEVRNERETFRVYFYFFPKFHLFISFFFCGQQWREMFISYWFLQPSACLHKNWSAFWDVRLWN